MFQPAVGWSLFLLCEVNHSKDGQVIGLFVPPGSKDSFFQDHGLARAEVFIVKEIVDAPITAGEAGVLDGIGMDTSI